MNTGLTRSKIWIWISFSLLLIALEFNYSKIASVIPCCRIHCSNVCNSFALGILSSCLICSSRTTNVVNYWNDVVPTTISSSLLCAGMLARWRTARYAWWTELASPYYEDPPPTGVCCNGSIKNNFIHPVKWRIYYISIT
jgi:hypothetical protein